MSVVFSLRKTSVLLLFFKKSTTMKYIRKTKITIYFKKKNGLYMCSVWSVSQSRPILCGSMDYSLPGFSAHGINLSRILEWDAISYSRGSSQTRDQTCVPCVPALASGFFTSNTNWEAYIPTLEYLKEKGKINF